MLKFKAKLGGRDCSIAEGFQQTIANSKGSFDKELMLKYAQMQITTELAEDWVNISCRDWEEDEAYGEKPEEMFRGGYDQIPNALSRGLDIRPNHVATHVHYGGDGCLVQCQNGQQFHSAQCVVTLTLGCLKAGDVVFTPPLSNEKLRGINDVFSL